MTEQNDLLRYLYTLKSFGYHYVDMPEQHPQTPTVLPNTLPQLAHMANACHLCSLSKTRKNVVFGEGNPNAVVMFVGEGPGATEDETGRPFVGRAGELLTKMIENVLQIPRREVYIANIVKCRPPDNRVPTPQEAQMCKPYLQKQIALIAPKIIVALGATSYRYLTGDTTGISKIRGIAQNFQGAHLVPTFHPSFLLRNESAKKEAYADLLLIKELMKGSTNS